MVIFPLEFKRQVRVRRDSFLVETPYYVQIKKSFLGFGFWQTLNYFKDLELAVTVASDLAKNGIGTVWESKVDPKYGGQK